MNSRLALLVEAALIAGLLALYAAGLIAFPIIYLFVLARLSLRFRKLGWRDVGLSTPSSLASTLIICMATAVAYQAADIFVFVPLTQRITGANLSLDAFSSLRGNLQGLARGLLASWSLAAFVEELVFRGYLFNRLCQGLGAGKIATLASLLASALLFGLAHTYQGPTGVVTNSIFGVLLGSLYLAGKKNLWFPILTHGLVDTIGFVPIFSGLYP